MPEGKSYDGLISSVLNLDTCRILATASGRILRTHFGASHKEWTTTKLKGLVVFGCDQDGYDGSRTSHDSHSLSGYWFKLIDKSKRRVVWDVSMPAKYYLDRPFFHVLPGSRHLWGILFNDDDEAANFFQNVTDRLPRDSDHSAGPPKRRGTLSGSGLGRPLKSMVSAPVPNSFVHVAHVGIDEKGTIQTSKDIDPTWVSLIKELQGYGVTQELVEENMDFVEGFLAGAKSVSKSTTRSSDDHSLDISAPPRKRIRRKPVVHFHV